jgi:predicted CopG family antitoxin
MAKTVTISDDLAERLEERRRETGQVSLDEVAQSLMEEALEFDDELDPNCGYTVEELRALIAEGEASEMTEFRSAAEVTAEVKRRYAARRSE